MGINIRIMTKEDKPRVMQILNATPEFNPTEVAVAEEVIDSYLGAPDRSGYYVLVAELDSTIVGYICFGPTPMTEGTWDMYWAAVSPDKQGQGIGSALFQTAERNIREAAGRLAIIETSSLPIYEKTRRFHNHQGYEVIACIPDFYKPGDDKLILQKRLR